MNKFLLMSLLTISSSVFAATQPAVKISRANCYAPFPNIPPLQGVGYYSESISYDRLMNNHKVRLGTNQISNTGLTRNKFFPQNNPLVFTDTWRGYAGFKDGSNLKWSVTGNHEEILSNNQYIQSSTRATNCNITQW